MTVTGNHPPDWEEIAASLSRDWLKSRRWFRRKSEKIVAVNFMDGVDLSSYADCGDGRMLLMMTEVIMESGRSDIYQLLLCLEARTQHPGQDGFSVGATYQAREAMDIPAFHTSVHRLVHLGKTLNGRRGTFFFKHYPVQTSRQCRALAQTSSNSLTLVKGDEVIKYLRRVESGICPELEMNRFFAENGNFTNLPALTGSLRYAQEDGREFTLAMVHLFVENQGDLWGRTQEALAFALESMVREQESADYSRLQTICRDYFAGAGRLAEVLGDMHRTLASGLGGPDFDPEPISPADLQAWGREMKKNAKTIFSRISQMSPQTTGKLRDFFQDVPAIQRKVHLAFHHLVSLEPEDWIKSRIHGDFHLGQVLKTSDDLFIIDFEGEPLKEQSRRVAKHSPMKDVAGLFRSYHYAADAALFTLTEKTELPGHIFQSLESMLREWCRELEEIFLQRYCEVTGLESTPDLNRFLAVLKLEKAVYELDYEINNRPDWLPIPVRGIQACLRDIFPESE